MVTVPAGLLGQVIGQDTELDGDGNPQIRQRVARTGPVSPYLADALLVDHLVAPHRNSSRSGRASEYRGGR